MADIVTRGRTSLLGEEVITRSIQFFTDAKWRAQTQSGKTATFAGKPSVPWGLLFLTFLSFIAFVIPGIIMYIFVLRKASRLQNIVVTANSISGGTEVVITHPKSEKKKVDKFLSALPPLTGSE